jgi:hypothetical protein
MIAGLVDDTDPEQDSINVSDMSGRSTRPGPRAPGRMSPRAKGRRAPRGFLVRQSVKGWRVVHQQGTPIPVSDCMGPAPAGDRQPSGLPRAASKTHQVASGRPAVVGRCRMFVGNTHGSLEGKGRLRWSQPCRPRTVNPSRELRRFESFTCHRVRERASDQWKRRSGALLAYLVGVSKLPLFWQSSGPAVAGL